MLNVHSLQTKCFILQKTPNAMPNAKLPFFRYMLIDQMLRNKRKPFPSKEEILDACREKFGVVSLSTIEKDIGTMRIDFDAPISYNRRMNGYQYDDNSYKFLSVNLSDRNLVALTFVETILSEFRDLPIFDEFSDAVDKVLDGLAITRNLNDSRQMSSFIQIDKSPYYKGSEMLGDFISLITTQHVCRITYQKFVSEKPKTYTLHPYLLKEYKHLWYVVGFVEEYKEVRIFGIDRVQQIEPLDNAYFLPEKANFDGQTFYKHCLGVSVLSQAPEKIILRFSPLQGKYLKAQPIHHTQAVLQDDQEAFIMSLELVVNYELKMLILGYGSNVKVLAPESLASQVQNELLTTLQFYKD